MSSFVFVLRAGLNEQRRFREKLRGNAIKSAPTLTADVNLSAAV
jgi:hypothetical protein